MFKPLAVSYMKKVLGTIEFMNVQSDVAQSLKEQIRVIWKERFLRIQKELLSQIRAQCVLETKYSTLNNVAPHISKKIQYPDSFTFIFSESITRDDFLKRVSLQWPDEDKEHMADYIIQNNSDLNNLERESKKIFDSII